MKRAVTLTIPLLWLISLWGCEDGDWLGPVERGLRGALNGWDMWDGDAVRPYEDPMPKTVKGTVPTTGRVSFEKSAAAFNAMPSIKRKERAALTYRRYCHHCHGPNGDGRIIVGESLELAPTDLRSDDVQSQSDEELFEHLQTGGGLMLPFAATLSPLEMLLSIEYMRTLKDRPSKPYFQPKYTEPLQ